MIAFVLWCVRRSRLLSMGHYRSALVNRQIGFEHIVTESPVSGNCFVLSIKPMLRWAKIVYNWWWRWNARFFGFTILTNLYSCSMSMIGLYWPYCIFNIDEQDKWCRLKIRLITSSIFAVRSESDVAYHRWSLANRTACLRSSDWYVMGKSNQLLFFPTLDLSLQSVRLILLLSSLSATGRRKWNTIVLFNCSFGTICYKYSHM